MIQKIRVHSNVIESVTPDLFEFQLCSVSHDNFYIAVPTASFGNNKIRIVNALMKLELTLKFYGPVSLDDPNYLGFLSREKMIELISQEDAMLFLFEYEALGLIPIESIALGTPVITYRKQGPYLSVYHSKFVTYVESLDNIVESCQKALSAPLIFDQRVQCRESFRELTPDLCVKRFLRHLRRNDPEETP